MVLSSPEASNTVNVCFWYHIKSWHGNTYKITGPLWRESTSDQRILLPKTSNVDIWFLFFCATSTSKRLNKKFSSWLFDMHWCSCDTVTKTAIVLHTYRVQIRHKSTSHFSKKGCRKSCNGYRKPSVTDIYWSQSYLVGLLRSALADPNIGNRWSEELDK